MPGNNITFYCELFPAFLDHDKSFYLWIKYADFYAIVNDEIRHVTLNGSTLSNVFNVNVSRRYDKKLQIPVTYN